MSKPGLISEAKYVLHQLLDSIQQLSYDEYTQKIALLSNASIGEHTRHIIELFQQLQSGYTQGTIDYDDRKRDFQLQDNIDVASESIANIIKKLDVKNKLLQLTSVYNNEGSAIQSNYSRELMYNIEHCIHHQAIIRIAFLLLGKNETETNFGVAKSTLVYRQQCAQ